ncbi:MAG: RCC1 repeat-containing protein [Acidimicrobiales bacterium]
MVRSVVAMGDGRLLVAGSVNQVGMLVRLVPDGTLDPSFSDGQSGLDPGVQLAEPMRMAGAAVLPDGRILVAGSLGYRGYRDSAETDGGAVTVRLTADGVVDPTYGEAGVARSRLGNAGLAYGMAVQSDGKVVLAGQSVLLGYDRRFVVARLTADGRPDLSFGLGGETLAAVHDARSAVAAIVVLAPDGSLFVGGWASAGPGGPSSVASRHFVAHIESSGVLDPRFGTAGIATVVVGGEPYAGIGAVVVQADGAPVAVGYTRGAATNTTSGFVLRLLPARPGGPVVGWGWNGWGQSGDVLGVRMQAAEGARARADVAMVAAGAFHNLSVDADGRVWASGMNTFGQLGDGTTTDRSSPVLVAGVTGVIAVSAGAYHSLAVRADGSVWAWGWNGFGQLGDGTTVERHMPVQVAGFGALSGVKVAAGAFHSLALTADGLVRAWGWNGYGQLGNGTSVDQHVAVEVSGLRGGAGISTGAYHSLALRGDGSVAAWGWNAFGQLGDGTTVDRSRPVPVPGVTGVVSLGRGAWFHSMAVAADGEAWAWGWNGFGQLGDGTTVERHAPVRVAVPGLVAAAGGLFHSLGVDASGSVRAWGWNGLGQLGDGTTVDRHLAGLIRLPAGPVVSVAAGAYHSVAG